MAEYKDWLKKAEEDFDVAEFNIAGKKFEAGVFFLQQAAEKSLKALYIKRHKELFRTHDLVVLSKKLKAPPKIMEFSKKLTPAYQYTRYPDVEKVKNIENNIKEFIYITNEILKWTKKNL